MAEYIRPEEIEAESFRIIAEEIRQMGRALPDRYGAVIQRVIHTTADFSYLDSLYFSDGSMEAADRALRLGSSAVTDTNMARAGINERALGRLGGDRKSVV